MIGKVIRNILINDDDVSSVIAERVFAMKTPQNTTLYPYVNYSLVAAEDLVVQGMKHVSTDATYKIDLYSKDYAELANLSNKIRSALNLKYNFTVLGINISTIFFQDMQDADFDQKSGIFYRFLIFEISQNI